MIYAEILAGGSGTRMGNTDRPKQFLMLGNKPILVHTIEAFLLNPRIDRILVVVPNVWLDYSKDIMNKYNVYTDRVHLVVGGSTRNETIMNGCRYIESQWGITDEDIIVTHDSVRPFITQRIINDNIDACLKYGAVDTVIPAVDTIVESTNNETITNIPVRKYYYQGQTPQSFGIAQLTSLYNALTEEEKDILTDACKIFTMKGHPVHLVMGEGYNIKITAMYDLKLANAILEGHLHD
ncbi:MAG: 2-C-methyl-D-erythritol 4-phosphate cytidylyltransferase [Erysipelotrichaceae bacterium]|nr:2-C-methyl-D-erythritol 4-phosphate cytidylyltransferase [Erysipelotrichaceae bacterium]